MPTLSVAIVTFNEEANLARTLATVAWADEIIIVDSHSTDRTQEIAHHYNAQVIVRDWPGFALQKNFAISKCSGDWILSLDADEELSPELRQDMQDVLSVANAPDAFFLKRRNLFLGRWVKRGGFYPDPKLRLFRRRPGLTPAFTERPVHEAISFDGTTGTLNTDLIHHAYPTLRGYIEHMNRYSDLGADILLDKGSVSASLPMFIANTAIVPALTFVKNYVLRAGFLDGREGFLLHLYHAAYTSLKYAKAWERTRCPAASDPQAD